MKESIKTVVKMLAVAIAAVVVYLWGINLIDASQFVKPTPDYVGTISVQPPFENTVRSW